MGATGKRLRYLREKSGKSQEEMARLLGISRPAYVAYETGRTTPSRKLKELASLFNVSTDFILGNEPIEESGTADILRIVKKDANLVPRIGVIACGTPILAQENIEGYEYLRSDIQADFALIASGDSMQGARIFDGDIVFIKQQSDVSDGEIAAVLVDGEALLKRVYHTGDTVTLSSENPRYPPRVYSKDNCQQFKILGKVVCVQIKF